MTRITKKLEFDTCHRVLGHEGKCASLHGHRYVAEVTVEAPSLDRLGRAVDFSIIKQVIGGWVDEQWDHNMVLNPDDPFLKILDDIDDRSYIPEFGNDALEALKILLGPKMPFRMPRSLDGVGMNPTAEVMAEVLFRKSNDLLLPVNHQLKCVKVVMWETPTSNSEYPDR